MPTLFAGHASAALPVWKRSLDIAGALGALPVLGLFILGMAALVRLTSPGPIFFRQQRIGYKGQPFNLLKFRTMHVGAATQAHDRHVSDLVRGNLPMQKLDSKRDERVIRGAWIIRASGLDELPQVINVLRGEMSLVGPRPCALYELEHYTPAQRRRFEAVPGLTGLWQVSGKNRTTFDAMVRLDIDYVERRSLSLDLGIIALTLPMLAGQILETGVRRLRARR